MASTSRLIPSCAVLALVTVFLALLTVALGAEGMFGTIIPDLAPIPVLFVALRWPQLLPSAVPFAIGLTLDLFYGRTVGSGAITLLLVSDLARYWLARQSHHRNMHISTALVVFGLLHAILIWVLGGIFRGALPPLGTLLENLIGVLILYPLGFLLLRIGFPAQHSQEEAQP